MVKNINTISVLQQKVEKEEAAMNAQKKQKFGNFEFDPRHYLNTRLTKEEKQKEIVIRLLPFTPDLDTPFYKIHVHSVKMINENGQKQWKKFMCPVGMGKAEKCPFCELSEVARKRKFENKDDKELKEKYGQIEFMNHSKNYWLVRCIDREHEEDGVKFWRFPDARNGDGIFEKIVALVETKQRRGVEILDVNDGKDLVITVKRQIDSGGKEKMVYQIQDDEVQRPLSESEEEMEKWINDPMTWEDVYTIKDYEYLRIVAEGEYPVWNKDGNCWIAKSELDKLNSDDSEGEVENDEDSDSEDYTTFSLKSDNEEESTDDEDDLPF